MKALVTEALPDCPFGAPQEWINGIFWELIIRNYLGNGISFPYFRKLPYKVECILGGVFVSVLALLSMQPLGLSFAVLKA